MCCYLYICCVFMTDERNFTECTIPRLLAAPSGEKEARQSNGNVSYAAGQPSDDPQANHRQNFFSTMI